MKLRYPLHHIKFVLQSPLFFCHFKSTSSTSGTYKPQPIIEFTTSSTQFFLTSMTWRFTVVMSTWQELSTGLAAWPWFSTTPSDNWWVRSTVTGHTDSLWTRRTWTYKLDTKYSEREALLCYKYIIVWTWVVPYSSQVCCSSLMVCSSQEYS